MWCAGVQAVGSHYGCVKVTPPAEFTASASSYSTTQLAGESALRVHNPARQQVRCIPGYRGMFQVYNLDWVASGDTVLGVQDFHAQALSVEAKRSLREKSAAAGDDWKALERAFWSGTTYSKPMYGADSEGSLFDADAPWNVARLPSLLHVLSEEMPGINLPFLYWGTWRSLFACMCTCTMLPHAASPLALL